MKTLMPHVRRTGRPANGGPSSLSFPRTPSGAPAAKPRIAYIDNIRWTVIAMVVLVHACVTYGGLGSWYYKEPGALDLDARLVFWMYSIFSQAFFMGLLFFVAAMFMPSSYDRKGFAGFVGERAFRLGIPALFFMLVLDPLTTLARDIGTGRFDSVAGALGRYPRYLASGAFLDASGPLWFAVALLGFALVYALGRLAVGVRRGATPSSRSEADPAPSARAVHLTAAILMVTIAAGSFLARLGQPIGTSWHNMQLCFFPEYVVMFVVGLWAGRRGFLRALPREAGMVWLKLAFAVGVPVWFLLLGLGGAFSGNEMAFTGGLHWQAAGYAAWEAFFAVSVSIGLLTLYRERVNVRNRGTGLLAEACFGIYVFHAPILVAVSMVLRTAVIYPLAKAAVAAAIAFALSLGVAWMVRRIPVVGRVFA
jgi:glucan biosynthesis protein C